MSTQKQTTEEMIKKLKDVQKKIESFEVNYDSKYNHLEKRSKINNELDQKNEELLNMQNSIVSIDLGGKLVCSSTSLIRNCRFDNILVDLIENSNKIFVDIPYNYFKRILFILRNKSKDSSNNQLLVTVNEKMSEDMMESIIKIVFKGGELALKELKIKKEDLTRTGNVMDFLYRKDVDLVIPIVNPNAYNDYNNANYNNANYNEEY